MQLNLPTYSSKDYHVLTLVVLPVTGLINYIILGSSYYSGWPVFLTASVISMAVISLYFTGCGWWAVRLKHRFSRESEVGRKLFFMISTYLVATGLVLLLLFRLFEWIPFFHFRFDQDRFVWAYAGIGFMNVFLSFLFEGISNYEDWRSNLEQTEQIRKAFQQSQLHGLKSQVNPHFLFNSLNSLSSLIEDDHERAEQFLDEMSKVYRYMLRNDEDQLVTVRTELQFLASYLYLLQVRFGNALQVHINLNEEVRDQYLPPLTLQVLIEDAFNQNTVSKQHPLDIEMFSDTRNVLYVRNRINPKMMRDSHHDQETGLDHLIVKYRLMDQEDIRVEESEGYRTVRLPLIEVPRTVVS